MASRLPLRQRQLGQGQDLHALLVDLTDQRLQPQVEIMPTLLRQDLCEGRQTRVYLNPVRKRVLSLPLGPLGGGPELLLQELIAGPLAVVGAAVCWETNQR